jgi:hypothetical protein
MRCAIQRARTFLVAGVACSMLVISPAHGNSKESSLDASSILGGWLHVPTDGVSPPLDSLVFRRNGTYTQWLYITSPEPQRVDGKWSRTGRRYRLEYSGAGDFLILKNGYLVLADEEGVVRTYRRTHTK